MRVVRVHAYGGRERLRLDELPTPEAGANEVRASVAAAGVNFIDVYHRTGLYKLPLPLGIGIEGAGTVEAVGADVRDVAVGDRIAWVQVQGSYATHALVPAERVVKLPDGVDLREGAALLEHGMTAHYLSHSTYAVKAGDTCLVHAAAGGVGALLVQLAKLRGARVIGTVSSEAKERRAREAGADEVIRYTEVDFESEVRRLTGGKGVSVVYDGVGKATFLKSLGCLARRGTLVWYGQASGPPDPLDPQLLQQKGSLYLTRPSLIHYTATREEYQESARAVLDLYTQGKLRLRIDRTFPLEQAAAAHASIESRETMGKVLLLP